jgi:quercetin dioxygenase-like cupin family protein
MNDGPMLLEHCGSTGEVVAGPLFVRKVRLTATTPDIAPHVHAFSHVTFFMGGQIAVTLTEPGGSSQTVECRAGDYLLVPVGVTHSMHLLSAEAECACVFVNRDATEATL